MDKSVVVFRSLPSAVIIVAYDVFECLSAENLINKRPIVYTDLFIGSEIECIEFVRKNKLN